MCSPSGLSLNVVPSDDDTCSSVSLKCWDPTTSSVPSELSGGGAKKVGRRGGGRGLLVDEARVTGLGRVAAATGDMEARIVSVVPVSAVPVSVVVGEGTASGETSVRIGVAVRF